MGGYDWFLLCAAIFAVAAVAIYIVATLRLAKRGDLAIHETLKIENWKPVPLIAGLSKKADKEDK